MEDQTERLTRGVLRIFTVIAAATALLAFALPPSEGVTTGIQDSARTPLGDGDSPFEMRMASAEARRQVTPDMIKGEGVSRQAVHSSADNLGALVTEKPPSPAEPPFGPDRVIYSSATADSNPRIAFNPTDAWLWVVFTHFNGIDDDVYLFYSNDVGVSWYPMLQTTGAFNESNPSIAIAGNTIIIVYEQDKAGEEQHTYFIRSQDDGQTWGSYYVDWNWTNDPAELQLGDFNDPDVSASRPQWFYWAASAWGVRNATRTTAFMWTEDDGDTWSMRYWNATGHLGEDHERPVIMENRADEYVHMAWQRENSTEGGYDIEYMILNNAQTDVWGWWTAKIDGGNTEIQPDIAVRNDIVYLTWQNGTVDPDLNGFYSDDGAVSIWFMQITSLDGYGQMYPATYLDHKLEPHISAINGTSIAYFNTTGMWKADDTPGNVVSDFRATDIICVLTSPRIVFADNRLGASDIWFTDLGNGCSPTVTIERSPPMAQGDIFVDGVPCPGTCEYSWILGSAHSLQAPTFMTHPNDTNTKYRFSHWSDGGAQNHTILAPSTFVTVTAYYDSLHNITLATAPDPNLRLVVDSVPYIAPQSFWWTLGESHNLEAPSPQDINGTSRYVWQSWSDGGGRSHSVDITQVETFTATFAVEYLVNITTSPGGLEVEVDGTNYTTPTSFWWLDGSVHNLTAISPQYVSQDERFRYVDWSDGLGIRHQTVVSGPQTITAYYVTQYNVSFTTSPVGLDIEVDGIVYDLEQGPLSFFWDAGSIHTVGATSPQPVTSGMRYVWLSWNDMGAQFHDITITGPTTFTANFGVEFKVELNTDPPGLNVTIDGIEYPAPVYFWCPQGFPVMVGAPSPQSLSTTMRYSWVSWSDMGAQLHPIVCNSPITLTASFVPQYLITVTSEPVLFNNVAWYDTGSIIGLTAQSPIVIGDIRYVFSHWNDGGPQSHLVTVTGPATYIAYYDTQFLITITSAPVTGLSGGMVDGVPITTPYQFWCNPGSAHVIGAPPQLDGPVPDSRWLWRNWSDGGARIHSIICDVPENYTANYVLQYRLTILAPLTIDFDGVTYDAPYFPWCDDLSVHNIGVISPQDQVPGSSRYMFTSWSDGGAQYHNITVTGADVFGAYFKLQYKVTITTDPAGLEILVDGIPHLTQYATWLDSGTSFELDVPSPQVVAAGERYVFSSWSDSQPKIRIVIVAQSLTYTANMNLEFEVIIDSTPVGGIQVTVDGFFHTTSSSFWWKPDSPHLISAVDYHDMSSGVRLAFTSWSDGGARIHYIVADMPKLLTAAYTAQYYLSVAGCNPQGEGWYEDGEMATFSTDSPCPPGALSTRYMFSKWTGDSWATTPVAQILMDGSKTVIAVFVTQYHLTVDSDLGATTGEGWYDSGEVATAGLDMETHVFGQTRYVFAQWTGDASGTDYSESSPILMDEPKTATAEWGTQYYLTVDSAHGDPTGEGWYDSGTTATFSVTTPYAGTTGTQYLFSTWSGDSSAATPSASVTMNAGKTVTAVWITQYELTVTSTYGNPQGSGWYASGATAPFSVTSPSPGATGVQYVFSAWTGDSTATTASATITMNAPKTVTASWTTQYYLTVVSVRGTTTGQGWYDAGSQAMFSVTSPVTEDGTEYAFTGWSGDSTSSSKSATIVMDGPKTVEAKWEESGFLAKYWWIFPVIIIIIIVVILAIWMMGRRQNEQEHLT